MFRFEKLVEQTVNLEQAFTRDADLVAAVGQETPLFQCGERFGKGFARVGAELGFELLCADRAELELQDELADVTLVGRVACRRDTRELPAFTAST